MLATFVYYQFEDNDDFHDAFFHVLRSYKTNIQLGNFLWVIGTEETEREITNRLQDTLHENDSMWIFKANPDTMFGKMPDYAMSMKRYNQYFKDWAEKKKLESQ